MCDLFQANPWKPLLCANCHQNRSGHRPMSLNRTECNHSTDLTSSSSTMHLYEEIMAQYFTINSPDVASSPVTQSVERLPTPTDHNELEEDSFSDEEQELIKPPTIEFITNQSMINTQGIVLMGPELRAKEIPKKSKKLHLLRKSKSNADECLKKTDIVDGNPSKLWWFKAKKALATPHGPAEPTTEANKSNVSIRTNARFDDLNERFVIFQASSPILTTPNQLPRIRVLPEINKLTLSEGMSLSSSYPDISLNDGCVPFRLLLALNIARRQHSTSNREPRLPIYPKTCRSAALPTGQSNYGSSIASTTSSSTQSSSEYESSSLNALPTTATETTYLVATTPLENNLSLNTLLDTTNRVTLERITADLRLIIDEYKRNLPVARFQTLKSFLHQHQASKLLSNEGIYFLLLQLIHECPSQPSSPMVMNTFDHFLIAQHSTLPIVVTTTAGASNIAEEKSMEQFIQELAHQLLDGSPLPPFHDLSTLETICCRYLSNHVLQFSTIDLDDCATRQRVQLLHLFWNRIQSVRNLQITEENERLLLVLYYLMRRLTQSDSGI